MIFIIKLTYLLIFVFDSDLLVGGTSGAGAGAGGGSPAPGGQNMKFGGLPYEMHRLGGRNEVSGNISDLS